MIKLRYLQVFVLVALLVIKVGAEELGRHLVVSIARPSSSSGDGFRLEVVGSDASVSITSSRPESKTITYRRWNSTSRLHRFFEELDALPPMKSHSKDGMVIESKGYWVRVEELGSSRSDEVEPVWVTLAEGADFLYWLFNDCEVGRVISEFQADCPALAPSEMFECINTSSTSDTKARSSP